jgi:hypothetical protein
MVWNPTKQYINNNRKYDLNENCNLGTQSSNNLFIPTFGILDSLGI